MNICPKCGSGNLVLLVAFRDDLRGKYRCSDCGCDFVYPPSTLFDRITASPEVLAEKLVYLTEDAFGDVTWSSTIVPGWYVGREDCIAATIKELERVIK